MDRASQLAIENQLNVMMVNPPPQILNPLKVRARGRPPGARNGIRRNLSAHEIAERQANGNRCSVCQIRGHNRRRCPTLIESDNEIQADNIVVEGIESDDIESNAESDIIQPQPPRKRRRVMPLDTSSEESGSEIVSESGGTDAEFTFNYR